MRGRCHHANSRPAGRPTAAAGPLAHNGAVPAEITWRSRGRETSVVCIILAFVAQILQAVLGLVLGILHVAL